MERGAVKFFLSFLEIHEKRGSESTIIYTDFVVIANSYIKYST